MDLQIFSKDIDLTDDIYLVIEKKITNKLSKYFKNLESNAQSRLTISRGDRFGFNAKLELTIKGEKLFAESTGKELVSALTTLSSEIVRIVNKHKEKNSF